MSRGYSVFRPLPGIRSTPYLSYILHWLLTIPKQPNAQPPWWRAKSDSALLLRVLEKCLVSIMIPIPNLVLIMG